MSADLIERLRAHAGGHLPLGWTDERMLLEEVASALEASATEGERRGLERAAEVAEANSQAERRLASSCRGVNRKMANEALVRWHCFDRLAGRIRALIPEAPAREASDG